MIEPPVSKALKDEDGPSRAETKEQKKPRKSPCLTREIGAPKEGLACGKTQPKQDLNTRKRRDIRELRNETRKVGRLEDKIHFF